jgi:RNA polymerase sigma factor (sigma-70 family)
VNLEQLYKQHRRAFVFKVRPYVQSYDVAEEIVQEAFTKALAAYHQYDPRKGPLKGWFTKVLFSCVWSHLREIKKRPPMYDIDLVLESDLLAYEEEPNLREYVSKVFNTKHRQVLLGYFVLGNTYEELASLLGITQDNARKVVQRFRDNEKEIAN